MQNKIKNLTESNVSKSKQQQKKTKTLSLIVVTTLDHRWCSMIIFCKTKKKFNLASKKKNIWKKIQKY